MLNFHIDICENNEIYLYDNSGYTITSRKVKSDFSDLFKKVENMIDVFEDELDMLKNFI